MSSSIRIAGLSKSYPSPDDRRQPLSVISELDLSVRDGEFVTFFGPNGCGKTTLLNAIAGLIDADDGVIEINGRPPRETRVGYVFQSFQLSFLNWKTVEGNIAFPLELQGVEKEVRRDRVQEFLARLGIELPLHSYPYQLSGGQQQLLAISRALIFEPDVLLLDEPFNQLDYQTRIAMQDRLLAIWEKTSTTILFVSHDLDEAIVLGDRTVFLSRRPARIMDIMDNALPRPRTHALMQTQEFYALRNHGLTVFERALQ